MSGICLPCYFAGSIASCFTALYFGKVEVLNDLSVFFENNATGRIKEFTADTDSNGNVVIEGLKVDPKQSYTVFVTERNVNSPRLQIIIAGVSYDCIQFDVIHCENAAGQIGLTP